MRVRVRVGSESTAVGEGGSVATRPNDLEPKKEKKNDWGKMQRSRERWCRGGVRGLKE